MQGRFLTGHGSLAGIYRLILYILAMAFSFRALIAEDSSAPVPLRLNISWTTDTPAEWFGEIKLANGFFWNSIPLGSDRAASVAVRRSEEKSGRLLITTPDPVLFCGLQTTALAPQEGTILLSLRSDTGISIERPIRVSELQSPLRIPFDPSGNGILIERAPGDTIPLSVGRISPDPARNQPTSQTPSMVFDQGEALTLGLFTRYLPTSEQTRRLNLILRPSGEETVLWNSSLDLTDEILRSHPRLDLQVPLDRVQGAFDLTIQLTLPGPNAEKGCFPFMKGKPEKGGENLLDSRVIQGVVVAPDSSPADPPSLENLRGRLLETIDPTNPSWWQLFSKYKFFSAADPSVTPQSPALRGQESDSPFSISPLASIEMSAEKTSDFLKKWRLGELQTRVISLKGLDSGNWGQWDSFWQHPLSSGHLLSDSENGGKFVRLGPSSDKANPAWEAYTIPIKEPGKPHLLEIDYPADSPMALGVSVLEPSVSGGLFPRTLDSGVVVSGNTPGDRNAEKVLRYQLLFWPKTQTPTILMTAPNPHLPARYGRMRIYQAEDQWGKREKTSGRSFAAVMTRPFLCDQFGASRLPSDVGVTGAEDWRTFDCASRRLTDYLGVAGYDTLMMTIAADGSALFPSLCLCPNPMYDRGVFLHGEDPVRKDVPELIFRLCDQKNLSFIPMIDFNAPLPELAEATQGLQDSLYSIGPDGKRYTLHRPDGGTITPYNLLNSRVQNAILHVLDETVSRYASHASFGGLGLLISNDSSLLLPDDPLYGLDDETFGSFAQLLLRQATLPESLRLAARQAASAQGPDRFSVRAAFLQGEGKKVWLQWRCEMVASFIHRASVIVANRSSNAAPLHLVWTAELNSRLSTNLFSSDQTRGRGRFDALIRAGYEPSRIRSIDSVVFYRPGSVSSDRGVWGAIADRDAETSEAVSLFGGEWTNGTFFYHGTSPRNLPTFDVASPFHPTVTELESSLLPSDEENRRRFAHQIALSDSIVFADGGKMIPLGGEESLEEWIDVWHHLPKRPFQLYSPVSEETSSEQKDSFQPVTVRTLQTEDAFWVYFVNDAPFHTGIDLTLETTTSARVETFVGGRAASGADNNGTTIRWNLSLRPYDLVAIKTNDPQTVIRAFQVSTPDEICASGGKLENELEKTADRIFAAMNGLVLPMENPGFNRSSQDLSGSSSNMNDWGKNARMGLDISKVNLLKRSGETSAPIGPVPGWEVETSEKLAVAVDPDRYLEGDGSLRLIGRGDPVRMTSHSFTLPSSGRLFVSLAFGLTRESLEQRTPLPLQIQLSGSSSGKPWQRTVAVNPQLASRAAELYQKGGATPVNGLIWIHDLYLFDSLPVDSTEEVRVSLVLTDRSVVWIDDLKLYTVAFLRSEQTAILQELKEASTAYRQGRLTDASRLLNLPVSILLNDAISDTSPLLAHPQERPEYARFSQEVKVALAEAPAETQEPAPEEKEEKSKGGFFRKVIPW